MGADKQRTSGVAAGRSSKNRAGAMLGAVIGSTIGLAVAGGLVGCTSYTNVPGPDNYTARQDPNARQASAATEAGLQWAVRRHPVQGRYAINLPIGTSLETAQRIANTLGPNAVIPDRQDIDLPTYHVTRVWIRVSDAKVDVVYPLTTLDGRQITRGVTTWLHAGVRPWVVSRGQYWAPGTVQTPPVWVPLPQAELDAMARAERDGTAPPRRGAGTGADPSAELPQPSQTDPVESEPTPYEPTQTEPVPNEPVQSQPAPSDPGAVWREVPVRGG